jgi:feruloyl esterase
MRKTTLYKAVTGMMVAAIAAGCGGGGDSGGFVPVVLPPATGTTPVVPPDAPPQMASNEERCRAIAAQSLPGTEFTVVEYRPAGDFPVPKQIIPTAETIKSLPEFCRLSVRLTPSNDSDIKVEIWLPGDHWNGRMLGLGNGGFAGFISYESLAAGLRRGYAVAHTDMGTGGTTLSFDGSLLRGHPEKWIDWGYRSTHLMTVLSKASAQRFYSKPPAKSYFMGCSTGGGQGIHEATRYPDDYDGIISGAPANDRIGTHIGIATYWATMKKIPAPGMPADKMALLSSAVLEACDSDDGVKDGLISRPEKCTFNPRVLQCLDAGGANCLTADQVSAVEKLYSPVIDPVTGAVIAPQLEKGSEPNWSAGLAIDLSTKPPFGEIFSWVLGNDFDFLNFDYSRDRQTVESVLGPVVNATSKDLTKFRDRGGKIIGFNGTMDALIPPAGFEKYLTSVSETTGAGDSFIRFYKAPGMDHCGGGLGPNVFGNDIATPAPLAGDPSRDLLAALERWVETGDAPDRIIATKFKNNNVAAGEVAMTRPLCPFPKFAKYDGVGDPNSEKSFSCQQPG